MVMDHLESVGMEITINWTAHDDASRYKEWAKLDRYGVGNCDVFVLVNSGKKSSGKMWECGIADSLGTPMVFIGKRPTVVFRDQFNDGIVCELPPNDLSLELLVSAVRDLYNNDMVNHPAHYNMGNIEVVDYILDQKFGYLLGNAVKYVSRCRHKGKYVEDLRKAIWYLNKAIGVHEDPDKGELEQVLKGNAPT
jgi:hypothetical protein